MRGQILGSLGRRLQSHHLRGKVNPVEHRLQPAAVEVGRRGVVSQLERQRAPHLQRYKPRAYTRGFMLGQGVGGQVRERAGGRTLGETPTLSPARNARILALPLSVRARTSSGLRASRERERTKDTCTPRERCSPAHSMHSSVPYVTETQGLSSVTSHLEGARLRVGAGRPGAARGGQGRAMARRQWKARWTRGFAVGCRGVSCLTRGRTQSICRCRAAR